MKIEIKVLAYSIINFKAREAKAYLGILLLNHHLDHPEASNKKNIQFLNQKEKDYLKRKTLSLWLKYHT